MRSGWLVAIVCAGACDRTTAVDPPRPAAPPPKAGELVQPGQVRGFVDNAGLAVIVPAGGDVAAIEHLARARAGAAITVRRTTLAELGWDQLHVHSLVGDAKGDEAAIGASPGAVVLIAPGAGLAQLRAVAQIARGLADTGWIFDPGSGQLYRAGELDRRVPATLDLRELITVHGVTGDNTTPYLDTLGMRRLGFPELYIPAAAPALLDQLTLVMDATAQTLVGKGDITAPGELAIDLAAFDASWGQGDIRAHGGKAKLAWRVRWAAEPDLPGAPLAMQLESPDGTGVEQLVQQLDRFYGPIADHVVQVRADDPEILAARARARQELAALRPHFAKGIPPKERLEVKAPFTTVDGGIEWMWIDVIAFHGDTLDGTLDSDPESVPSLRAGAKVHAKLAELSDYWHVRADGTSAGHYTLEIMTRRGIDPTAPRK
ncbi:MAG: DUF2314 domain-containing protein [Acidobacteriota bacterium]